MTIEEHASLLADAVEEFARCVSSLPAERFLAKMDEWSPRDVLAHLIGWNRCTVVGSEQIRKGETPFSLIDPGEDFSRVNAGLVREVSSRDRGELLEELEASCRELCQHLRSMDPADWEYDYGVRYKGFAITVQNSVDALTSDYVHHRRQIVEWTERTEGP